MGTILKYFIEFVTILLLLYVFLLFGPESCGILAPQTGIKHTTPEMEDEVLTIGTLRKSQHILHYCIATIITDPIPQYVGTQEMFTEKCIEGS